MPVLILIHSRIESDSIRIILNHSDICIRANPNQSEKFFESHLLKSAWKLIRLNPIQSETSIRMSPYTNPNQSEHWLIRTENLSVSELILIKYFIRIHSDRSLGLNQNYSESFRYVYSSQFESIRINPKNVLNLVCWKHLKIISAQSDSIRELYLNESERIRSKFSTRMNQNQTGHGLIKTEYSI